MLCETCQQLDVFAIVSEFALQRQRKEPEKKSFDEVPRIFEHHLGINALEASANDGCELWFLIWEEFTKS